MRSFHNAKQLRIFSGESDRVHHQPLYEAVVHEAHRCGLAGATVCRGLMSYGPSSRIHTAKLLDLASELPVIIEIIDETDKIDSFLPKLNVLLETAQCGGLVTLNQVDVIRYLHGGE